MELKSYMETMRLTEAEARAHLESIRWPSGPACVHCGSVDVYRMEGKSTRPGLFKCRDCRRPFSVMVGTIFEDSHIPLAKWVAAFHIVCASKKGVSALQLQRMLDLGSYRSAWHMAHRIRHAMASEPLASMLSGIVEADETYVGGKPRHRGPHNKKHSGHGTKKTPVAALVQREGDVRTRAMKKVTGKNVREMIDANVDKSRSTLMTDESLLYKSVGKEFAGGHGWTKHALREDLKPGGIHSNTVESFFGIVKRSIMGSYHHVSCQHLPRYLSEREFMWNQRRANDAERTVAALQATEGKRLSYRGLKAAKVAKPA